MNAVHKWTRAAGLAAVAITLCLYGCNKTPSQTSAHRPAISLGSESIPLGRLPRVAIPLRYRIALRVDPKADRFSGHAEIDVRFLAARRSLFLHGNGLSISGVTVKLKSGQSFAAHYDQVDDSGVARLIFVDQVPAGEATLIFDYDAPFNGSLEGLYKVVDHGDSYAFTQFEDTDARRAFPSFDEPGFKTPFDVTVIAPRGLKVIGNTPIVAAAPASHGMVDTVFETTKPLPTYLVALAVGPLDVVDGGWAPPDRYRSRPLHIRGITARGQGGRIGYALSLTPKVVVALENYLGIGFPFPKLDILAVPDFGPGAMENAGAITFRERLLLIDADSPLEQKRSSLAVQAHEISHQWFGDLVTPAWWDDIWLNESFANWAELKASAAVLPEDDFSTDMLRDTLEVMDIDELPSARQIHQPIANIDDLAGAFDGITYDKGAAVLAMFESYVGPQAWQRGIHAYLTKYARGNATAQDFIDTMAAATGHSELAASFHDFIDRPGIPYLQAAESCAALSLTQSAYAPFGFAAPQRRWRVPVCALDGGKRSCQIMQGASLTLPLQGACSVPPLPNAGGYYRFALDEDGWRAQIAGAAKLDSTGQILLMGNLFAGLRAGKASADDVLALIRTIAPVAHWDVLRSLSANLHSLRAAFAPGDLPAYRAFISRNFLGRWKSVGMYARLGEKPADTLAREYLATLLVSEARDPGVIAQLSLATPGPPPRMTDLPQVLAPELRAEALRATLIADPAYADRLVADFLSTNEEGYRRDIVYGFAGSEDPRTIGKLLALAATRIRTGELRYLSAYMADEPVARQTLWAFVGAHYDDFAKRLTQQGMGRMTDILQNACDAKDKADAEAFFQARMGGAPAAARRLAHTEERIDRCIALRKAKGPEISAALAAAH